MCSNGFVVKEMVSYMRVVSAIFFNFCDIVTMATTPKPTISMSTALSTTPICKFKLM